jgi:hypothetical protein
MGHAGYLDSKSASSDTVRLSVGQALFASQIIR